MKRFYSILMAVVVILIIQGCSIAPKSYVDQSFKRLSYTEIIPPKDPYKLRLSTEFQRSGKHYPNVDNRLAEFSEQILRRSKVINPTSDGAIGDMKITINNFGDPNESAKAKGALTGLTLGLVGSTVNDNYELSAEITSNGISIRKSGILATIHTSLGNTSLPDGVEVLTPAAAVNRVWEQMMLRLLVDLQQSGEFRALDSQLASNK